MTKQEALKAVNETLQKHSIQADDSLVIREELTIERPFGWVFFYDSRRFLETGDPTWAIAGNGPVFVNKNTGEVLFRWAAEPIAKQIGDYEASLNRM
jgi:hypothetical protein